MDKSNVKKILNLYRNTNLGTQAIADKLGLSRSPVGKILTEAFKNRTLIKKKQGTFEAQQKFKTTPKNNSGKRKIYKTIRPILDIDRKKNPNIPKRAKYKTQLSSGMKYFITQNETQKAIDESDDYVKNILPSEISARQMGNTSGFQRGNKVGVRFKRKKRF